MHTIRTITNAMSANQRLTNKTHLYVMSTTNLFYLEDSSRWNRVKRSKNQSVSKLCIESWISQNIEHFSTKASIHARDHDLFITVCALLLVFYTHRIIRLEISVVSTSIDRLNKTTKAKENTWVIEIDNRFFYYFNKCMQSKQL